VDEIKRGRGTFDGWSKSSLKQLLENCSWQWALQKLGGLEGPPTPHSAAGTGMHAGIEEHERSRIGGADPVDLVTLLPIVGHEAAADAANIPSDWARIHGDEQTAVEWAIDLFTTWYDSPVRRQMLTYTPLAVEPHIEVPSPIGPHNLRGYLDWVGRDADGVLTVVDYKSSSSLSRWSSPDKHILEAAVYLYLVATTDWWSGDEPIRMEWHVVSRKGDSKILEGPTFDAEVQAFLIDQLASAQRMVDSRGWKTNPSWGLCSDRWCPFYHGCQVTGALSPESVSFDPPAAASSHG